MDADPRRLTAIIYLVPEDWDASPQADGGQLVWWREDEAAASPCQGSTMGRGEGNSAPARAAVAPACGRLVMFDSRAIMHEVLPTHRKRFAVTLWYYGAQAVAQSNTSTMVTKS
eukprot:scaffold7394_cov35-Tisochrysis_lutea.AAC.3